MILRHSSFRNLIRGREVAGLKLGLRTHLTNQTLAPETSKTPNVHFNLVESFVLFAILLDTSGLPPAYNNNYNN